MRQSAWDDAMQIELTRGLSATIDDCDFDLVRPYRWVAQCRVNRTYAYAITRFVIDGVKKHILMHRLLLGLTDRSVLVDHIDGDGLNNKRSNIRPCSHAENMRNRKLHKHSASGIKGVRFEKYGPCNYSKWRGYVRLNGKSTRKWFDSKEAAEAWCIATRKLMHGDFSYEESRT